MGRLIGVTLVLEVCLRLLASTANSVFQHYPLFAERSAVLAEAYDAAEKQTGSLFKEVQRIGLRSCTTGYVGQHGSELEAAPLHVATASSVFILLQARYYYNHGKMPPMTIISPRRGSTVGHGASQRGQLVVAVHSVHFWSTNPKETSTIPTVSN